MKIFAKRLLPILCSLVLQPAYTDFPKEIVVIGDSLSDSGNSRPSVFGGIFSLKPRFTPITDGTTWPVLLAEKLGAKELLPSVQGGSNYAYVAALTKDSFPLFPNPSLTEQEQVLLFPKTNRKNPVFIFGGANDVLFSPAPQPGKDAAINISHILDDLHNKKYKTLIVFNLPDGGKIPDAGDAAPTYTANALLFNSTIIQELKQKKYPVIAIDLFTLFNSLIANPIPFGLNNSTGTPQFSTFPPPFDGTSTAGFVFWYDGTHLTQATHRLIADYVFSILTAAECNATLAELPFGMLREQRTTIHQQLAPLQPNHTEYQIYPFISGSYSPQLLPPFSDSCERKNAHGGDVSLGLTYGIGTDWTIGIAGSYTTTFSKCHELKNQCHIDLHAGVLSVFGGFSKESGYVNGIFNTAWLKYDKIMRKFYTGSYVNRARGHTHGIDYDAEIYGAYFIQALSNSHFKTGPFLEMDYQNVRLDGYKESGADFGNIKFNHQKNSIFSTGLGWEALVNYTMKKWELIMDVFLAANRQWLEKKRYIHFREVSLTGTHGAWPVRSESNTYASGGLEFNAILNSGPSFALGYTFNVGSKNMSEHFFTTSLTFPLGKKKNNK